MGLGSDILNEYAFEFQKQEDKYYNYLEQKENKMSELKFKGTLTHIGETNQVSDKFSKREFVINDNGMYPQEVQFEVINDNCSMLDSYKVGDEVEVHFNLRGRAWTKDGVTKYFNTLQAWRIEKDSVSYKPEGSFLDDDLPL